MTQPDRGRFVTLEGGEGAGKSTQARTLAEWLGARGIGVEITREPGGSPGAELIRGLLVTGDVGRWDPLTETLLHAAARRDHLMRHETVAQLRTLVAGDFAPDLTLILDVSPETRHARTAGRPGNEDRYERMNEAFHDRVRAGFKAIAQAEPGRCTVIDADPPANQVAAAIRAAIVARFSEISLS
jgi:dTMP kinase